MRILITGANGLLGSQSCKCIINGIGIMYMLFTEEGSIYFHLTKIFLIFIKIYQNFDTKDLPKYIDLIYFLASQTDLRFSKRSFRYVKSKHSSST